MTIPDTAAGRVLAAWLEAFNSGDQARFGIYQQKYEPAPDLPSDAVMAFRARTGGFDLVGIHKNEPLHIEFLVVVPDVKSAAADALTTAQEAGDRRAREAEICSKRRHELSSRWLFEFGVVEWIDPLLRQA